MYTKAITNASRKEYFSFFRRKLDMRLIRALFDEEASVTGLAGKAGSSKIRVSLALRKLMKEDIVKREVIGRTHRYSFNYCHRSAGEALRLVLAERAEEFRSRISAGFIFEFLKSVLGSKLSSIIFFGSCVSGQEFRDVDIFLVFKEEKEEQEKIGRIFEELGLFFGLKFSFMLGTEKEVEEGCLSKKDMFYANLMKGLPFGCEDFFISLKFREHATADARERFILGVRELISCRKHGDDPLFLKRHLEKGLFDLVYSALKYSGYSPADDYEAMRQAKEVLRTELPEKAKRGKASVRECLEFARTLSSKIF